ncbi:MAG TPA: DUF192 domain-containing protein [Rhizomicrobium sp.]
MRMLCVTLVYLLLAQTATSAATPHRLPVEKVVIDTRGGPRAFKMELAADDASRANGLMHRRHLAKDAGMLFDFGKPVMTAFWMKDTPLPLDMLFVRADGTISTVAANAVPFSTAEIVSAEPIRFVIEINGGLARTLGISPGDRVHAPAFSRTFGR